MHLLSLRKSIVLFKSQTPVRGWVVVKLNSSGELYNLSDSGIQALVGNLSLMSTPKVSAIDNESLIYSRALQHAFK